MGGSAVYIFSIASAVFRMRIASSDGQEQDLSWKTMPIRYATSIAEINIGTLCSCMPVVFVLFKGFSSWSASWITSLVYHSSNAGKQA
ncbi:hypothetical protein F5Y06DRAFT_301165 [Hypoxylon sp. FL0890]|nr:hypothetical protein F5Y06DRAFT_301165 [Hypoxylon sp. FL0890]